MDLVSGLGYDMICFLVLLYLRYRLASNGYGVVGWCDGAG